MADVLEDIRGNQMLTGGEKVLIALSGGPDSICLAQVLYHLKHALGITLSAAHVNYGLRGTESDQDELFSKEFCKRLDIPLTITRITSQASQPGNLEERLRLQRYDFLSGIACQGGMVIATGHNADDQAETFLLNLFRGSGSRGLAGMLPARLHRTNNRECKIIRPLLFIERKRIIETLESIGQGFRIDKTNLDQSFDRNWIRHQLMPQLRERFNPGTEARITKAAALVGEASQFLEEQAQAALSKIAILPGQGKTGVSIPKLRTFPQVLQKEIIRALYREARGTLKDLTSIHVNTIQELTDGQSGRKTCLPGNLEAWRDFDFLMIGPPGQKAGPFEYWIDVPGRLAIPEAGKTLVIELDKDSLRNGPRLWPRDRIKVRNRRPGDRLKISPHRPRQSFSNLCSRHRIPETARDRTLILEFADGSHWVEGTGMNDLVDIEERGRLKITILPSVLQSA